MNELGIVLILLICGAAIAAAAIIVAKLVTKNEEKRAAEQEKPEPAKYHYGSEGRVMSDSQQDFYRKLAEVFGERCYIFPNMALAALVDTEIKGQDAEKALERVAGQTVDYVMCHADSLKVLCVILLDDDQRVATLRGAGLLVAVMREAEQMEKEQIVDQIAAAVRRKN